MRAKLSSLQTVVITTALMVSGCRQAPAPAAPAQTPAQGTTPAQSTGTAPASQPAPAPATSATSAPAVAPVPAPAASTVPAAAPEAAAAPEQAVAPAPRVAQVIPAGSRVPVTITETLRASTSNIGDGFSGVLSEALRSRGGATVFPRGTRVAGTVVAAKGRGRFKGAGALGIELTSIGGVRVSTSEYEKAEKGKGKRTGALVGGGAGLGAIIGGLAGGGKGALIGGLAGAGAGTAGAAYTGNHDVVIPSESLITFTLRSSVSR